MTRDAMTRDQDLYKLLHVDPEADPDVVEAAFRVLSGKLSRDLDVIGVQEYRLNELTSAHETLTNQASRKAYDLRRALKLMPVGPGPARTIEADESPSHLAERVHSRMDAPDDYGEIRLDFGHYAGQTLREILRYDPDYLRWLSRHSSGIRFRGRILKLLAERVEDPYSGRPSR